MSNENERWKRVPVEPTMGMWDDFCAVHPISFAQFCGAYKSMIESAATQAEQRVMEQADRPRGNSVDDSNASSPAPAADVARELAECREKLARFEAAEKELPPEPYVDVQLDARGTLYRSVSKHEYDNLRTAAVAKIAELEAKLKERDHE